MKWLSRAHSLNVSFPVFWHAITRKAIQCNTQRVGMLVRVWARQPLRLQVLSRIAFVTHSCGEIEPTPKLKCMRKGPQWRREAVVFCSRVWIIYFVSMCRNAVILKTIAAVTSSLHSKSFPWHFFTRGEDMRDGEFDSLLPIPYYNAEVKWCDTAFRVEHRISGK